MWRIGQRGEITEIRSTVFKKNSLCGVMYGRGCIVCVCVSAVHNITHQVDYYDTAKRKSYRVRGKYVIYAGPRVVCTHHTSHVYLHLYVCM